MLGAALTAPLDEVATGLDDTVCRGLDPLGGAGDLDVLELGGAGDLD